MVHGEYQTVSASEAQYANRYDGQDHGVWG
jgi:hypothetical protein